MGRHLRAALTVGTAAATLIALAGSPDARAAEPAQARAASTWLASQLDERGTFPNQFNPDLVDGGLMIDALFAMHASGDPAAARPILRYLDDERHAVEYYRITYDFDCDQDGTDETDTIKQGGQTAKTLLAALVAGRDPRAFGGRDLVADTLAQVSTDPGTAGKLRDTGTEPRCASYVYDNSNTFGQVLAVIALAELGELTQPVVDALVGQQCASGFFRIYFYTDDVGDLTTCDEGTSFGSESSPDGDSTGFALSAMLAARNAGLAGLDDHIRRATSWLVDHQDPSGGWAAGDWVPEPNTNTTGLVVQGLVAAGGPQDVIDRGVAFLAASQARAPRDSSGALRGDLGAIAHTPERYAEARELGIGDRDQWIRATAQAQLGLAQVSFADLARGARPARVTVPSWVLEGRPVRFSFTGLEAGEPFVARAGGRETSGTASAQGSGGGSLVLTPGRRVVEVVGYAPSRGGAAGVQVVPARRIAVELAPASVRLGRRVLLRVTRLAPGEPVTISLDGRRAHGRAGADGVYRRWVVPKQTAGVHRLVARGAFAVRTGSGTVRVVL